VLTIKEVVKSLMYIFMRVVMAQQLPRASKTVLQKVIAIAWRRT
jgi:hypothetical protein